MPTQIDKNMKVPKPKRNPQILQAYEKYSPIAPVVELGQHFPKKKLSAIFGAKYSLPEKSFS